jgi:sugar diacid utilization regulator
MSGPWPSTRPSKRMRVGDALAMHLAALDPRSACALVGNVAYGILPTNRQGEDAEQRAVQIANEFLDRVCGRHRAVIGVGPPARTPAELARSRSTAGRVLRVLRVQAGTGRRAAGLADVHFEALLLELQDIATARGDRITGPVTRLIAYDVKHRTDLFETLAVWFDAFGDVAAVTAVMAIHANTLRYRLRRIAEVCGVDLNEPSTRLAMMLQVWMVRALPDGPLADRRRPAVATAHRGRGVLPPPA